MLLRPSAGFLMEALHIGLELRLVHPPNPASADLDGGQVAVPYERVDLLDAHREVYGDVFEGHEARFDRRPGRFLRRTLIWTGHERRIAPELSVYVFLKTFAY